MIGEVFGESRWLWPLLWQSTACLALGLGGSLVLRRRPVRAHQVLVLSLVAAVAAPLLSDMVKQRDWGLLPREATVVHLETQPFVTMDGQAIPKPSPASKTVNVPMAEGGTSNVAKRSVGFRVNPTQLFMSLWIIGATSFLVRLIIRFFQAYRLARQSKPITSGPVNGAVATARLRLGIRRGARSRCQAGPQPRHLVLGLTARPARAGPRRSR
jgi:hypothetical protein